MLVLKVVVIAILAFVAVVVILWFLDTIPTRRR